MIGLVDGNNFFVSCERVFNRRLVGRHPMRNQFKMRSEFYRRMT